MPGDLLKIEQATNVSLYTIPPKLALSRFLYTTQSINGTVLPNSAFLLWPWLPKQTKVTNIPLVAWPHGTSGSSPECAPSHIQNLLYEYAAPYTLALQGYAVVALDLQGLGVNSSWTGETIPSQYGANLSAANDVIFAVEAARKAWPTKLSTEFVVLGHSQGGGAAWAVAQQQLVQNTTGYLGSVAASPNTEYSQYVDNPVVDEPQY